jgi:tripartite-type tricarboxylate transporter receptor subunit TctC
VAPRFELLSWQGLLVPAGTPGEVVAKLHAAATTALAEASVQARLAALGFEVAPAPADRFGALLHETVSRFAVAAAVAGLGGGEA